jgi:UDP-N-acetyl-D-mannosaminuronate dehydrogenase
MSKRDKVVVVGLGEVGQPLLQLLSPYHDVIGVDINPPNEPIIDVDVLHICYPFEIPDFVGESARYIELFKPALTIIESTVGVGTTRAVADCTGKPVVHSPIRGKHVRMLEELGYYTKFVGAIDPVAGQAAAMHFESVGLEIKVLTSPEATELAKLTETTYFGLLIAWAQEVERYCDQSGADYNELVSFYEEISYLPPVKFFPGIIGRHCVMPNIEILSKFDHSQLLRAIRNSNQEKIRREAKKESAKNEAPAMAAE